MTEALTDDFDRNYARFIEDALTMGCVWSLQSPEGWALCPANSNDEIDVMPLWSQPEFAEHHTVDEWQDYEVVAIALDELLDDWLPGLHEDVILVGPNWNAELLGDEVEPLDLLEDFDQAVN